MGMQEFDLTLIASEARSGHQAIDSGNARNTVFGKEVPR